MARIRDFVVKEFTSTVATFTPDSMPVHESGDLLIAFWGKDSNGGLTQTGTTGGGTGTWTEYIDLNSAQANGGVAACRATASDAVFSGTLTTETGVIVVLSIADVYGTTLADAMAITPANSASDVSTIPFAGISGQSTSYDNCLILYALFTDGGTSPTAYAPAVNLYAGDATNGSLGVAYSYLRTAGSIATVNWFGRGNDDGRCMLMAIRPAASTNSSTCYSDPAISNGQVLRPLVGLSTMQSDTWPTSLTTTALGDDFDTVFTYVGSTYTDVTSAYNTYSNNETWPTAVGDMVYFGKSRKFQSILPVVITAGVAGVHAFEYWNGSSWVSTGVTSATLTSTGVRLTRLSPEAYNSMSTTTINSVSAYWFRIRTTTLFTTAVVTSTVRLDGRAAQYIVAAASADNGTNPYTDGASNAGGSSTTTLSGFQLNFGASLDMDTGIIYGTYRGALKRDLAVDQSRPIPIAAAGGSQLTLFDTNSYYKSYVVSARDSLDLDPDGRNVFAIDWNGSAVAWASNNTVNKSAVTRTYYSTYGYDGAVATVWSMLSLVTKIGIAGGNSTLPITYSEFERCVNSCVGIFPFLQSKGAAVDVWVPLQFGGADPIAIVINNKTFQFPTKYDGLKYFKWNAGDNVAGIKFYPKNGDVLNFSGCSFVSDSPFRWEFDSSMGSTATLSFTGVTVSKGTVTLQSNSDLDQVSFLNCPSFTQNGATLTNCEFENTKVTSSSLANAALISNSTFTKTTGTQHAIEISGSAADITLTGLSFTGYASSNGSTGNEAIYVNIASGTVNITITNGEAPSIRTAGATVNVIVGLVTVTVIASNISNVKVQNANVLLKATGTGPMPVNASISILNSSTTATVTHTAHGLETGDKVLIKGALEYLNNGVFTITKIDSNSYSYTMAGTPGNSTEFAQLTQDWYLDYYAQLDADYESTSPNCTYVALFGLTDSNGTITMQRVFSADQEVNGWVRKATSDPYYKTSYLSGTIDSDTGLLISSLLLQDI